MGWNERMRDAADPGGLHGWGGRVAGYLPGGDQFRAWSPAEWAQFGKQPKLPIFVRVNPAHPEDDACNVLRSLHLLGVPAGRGIWTALDLETVKAPGYVGAYGQALHWAGFKVAVYGSASTVFGNPPLDGYWVADYAGIGPFMYDDPEAVMTQYASGAAYDSSTVRIAVQADRWWT